MNLVQMFLNDGRLVTLSLFFLLIMVIFNLCNTFFHSQISQLVPALYIVLNLQDEL